MNFDRSSFTCSSHAKGAQRVNNFEFGIFIGRFPNDDAASLTVKGLIFFYTSSKQRSSPIHEHKNWTTALTQLRSVSFGRCWGVYRLSLCQRTSEKEICQRTSEKEINKRKMFVVLWLHGLEDLKWRGGNASNDTVLKRKRLKLLCTLRTIGLSATDDTDNHYHHSDKTPEQSPDCVHLSTQGELQKDRKKKKERKQMNAQAIKKKNQQTKGAYYDSKDVT